MTRLLQSRDRRFDSDRAHGLPSGSGLDVTSEDETEGATVQRQTDRARQRREDRAEAEGQSRGQIPHEVQPGPRETDEPESRERKQGRTKHEHSEQEGRQDRRQVSYAFRRKMYEEASPSKDGTFHRHDEQQSELPLPAHPRPHC